MADGPSSKKRAALSQAPSLATARFQQLRTFWPLAVSIAALVGVLVGGIRQHNFIVEQREGAEVRALQVRELQLRLDSVAASRVVTGRTAPAPIVPRRALADSLYLAMMEKTNYQLSLATNPYGIFIASLGLLF